MRKTMLVTLGIATAIECFFPIVGFSKPELTLSLFDVGITPDTLFLSHVISWCLLFLTVVCAFTLRLVVAKNPLGTTLCLVLGVWWMGIGLALAFKYGRMPNLVLDTLKGAVLAGSAFMVRRGEAPQKGDSVA